MTCASGERAQLVDPYIFRHDSIRPGLGTIVLCKGVYDLTHLGHIESLWDAKALGDTLVVAVASDRSVRERKGAGRPILTFRERVGIVTSLKMVDFAVQYDDASPFTIIDTVRPHIFCATHSKMLEAAQLMELKDIGVDMRIMPRPHERCTSDLIKDIRI